MFALTYHGAGESTERQKPIRYIQRMIKILRDLDLKADGVSIYNRKWQHVHLRQGDMDGACAVYSVMMNLLILKVLTRNQVTDLRTTFKGTTSKGRLYKEFFKVEGLCRDGFFFADISLSRLCTWKS